MRRLTLPGGRYGEALPSGAYAVLVPAQNLVDTHLGPIPCTLDLPLYPRITEVGGFQIAGQAATGGLALHYRASTGLWTRAAQPSRGVNGHIFDRTGTLQFAPPTTSQGYRYVADDGTLILGDATYADAARAIYEYTTRGDLTVGQGAQSGCLLLRGADRVVLEPGDTRFVHFAQRGDQLAITIAKLTETRTVLIWLTVDEIDTLPREAPVGTPPPPVPPPAPPGPPAPPVVRPPMSFPTDAEFLAFTDALETLYRDELQRGQAITHVDPLGRARWTYDYAQHRQGGASPAEALRRVVTEIRRIASVPNP